MNKSIKEAFDQIVAFKAENPEQTRSGCLYNQNANGETLKGYIIEDEVFKNCEFNAAKFISCQFAKCTFLNCNFTATELINCKFIECTVNNCDFTDAILTDTQFKDCQNNNNILNHIHCSGYTRGITNKDENIVQDELLQEDDETAMQQDLKTVFTEKITKIMQDNFSNWTVHQDSNAYPSFVLGDIDIAALSLYANPEKNSTDTDNFWDLSFFFNGESLLTTDFNFFGKEPDEIISMIKNWKDQVVSKDNADIIVKRIIETLQNRN